ncbi:MAG TPA: hypothetical protein VLV54_14380 [Thermoanaerobaculia bacterium]|nr:hypothetical protein [Thermoanaerobaculia bacterium]
MLDTERRINVEFRRHEKDWLIAAFEHGTAKFFKFAVSFSSFSELMVSAANSLGYKLEAGPRSIRMNQQTPVSNRIGIVHLAHGSTVLCIFDPYFEDKAISSLSTLVNLGLKLHSDVRVLTTSKVKGRLSQQLLADFAREHGSSLSIRQCDSDKEHRRFLLLTGGESVVIGCSLNSLDKNEAAHIEPSSEDLIFLRANGGFPRRSRVHTRWRASPSLVSRKASLAGIAGLWVTV